MVQIVVSVVYITVIEHLFALQLFNGDASVYVEDSKLKNGFENEAKKTPDQSEVVDSQAMLLNTKL